MARSLEIKGARTLITGASGGLGAALARRFAAEGAELILTGRRESVLNALADDVGGEVIVADLGLPDGPAQLLSAAGRVDILIANAALGGASPFALSDQGDIDRSLAVNLRAPMALAKGLLPQMSERDSGHIVFVGSLQSKVATIGATIYCATKFGLRGFALALRAELDRTGIGVSLVLPGFISEAGMNANSGVDLPRIAGTRTPEQVAQAILDAIRHDRGEAEVAPLALRAGATVGSLAPDFAARGVRLLGGERVARDFARSNAEPRE